MDQAVQMANFVADVFAEDTINPPRSDVAFFRSAMATPRLRPVHDPRLMCWGAVHAPAVDPALDGAGMLFSLVPGEFRCAIILPSRLLNETATELISRAYDGTPADMIRLLDSAVLIDRFFRGGAFSVDAFHDAIGYPAKRHGLKMCVAHIARTIWRSAIDVLVDNALLRIGGRQVAFRLPRSVNLDEIKRALPLVIEHASAEPEGRLFCVAQSSIPDEVLGTALQRLVGEPVHVQPVEVPGVEQIEQAVVAEPDLFGRE